MYSMRKEILKMQNFSKLLANPTKSVAWANISRYQFQSIAPLSQAHLKSEGIVKKLQRINFWNCCGRPYHTHAKGSQKLVEFLNKEVLSEYTVLILKSLKKKIIPTELHGFEASFDSANVTFTKLLEDEIMQITTFINLSWAKPNEDTSKLNKSVPNRNFVVEIIRKDTALIIYCSYPPTANKEVYQVYQILGISIENRDSKSDSYIMSNHAVNYKLYSLILKYLDEKGVTINFINELLKCSIAYEHQAYICLLDDLSKFASDK